MSPPTATASWPPPSRSSPASAASNPAEASSVVIGDTPRDVSAGHAVGARVLAVATGNYDEEALRESGADHVLPDLRDTQAALDILLG